MTAHPGAPTAAPRPKIWLLALPAPAIHALAAGDLLAANRAATITLTPFFVGPEAAGVWRRRSRQIETDPLSAGWITRAIWDADKQVAVGRAGYHGPPDSAGMVEIGYAVDPAWRRQGYARAAVKALLERAGREAAVRTVRATISPDNVASRSLVQQFGFVEVGEQWDDEDGLETIFEVGSRGTSRPH